MLESMKYQILLDEGYSAIRRGDPEAALNHFQRACESHPDRPQAYFAVAVASLEQNDSDQAIEALQKALAVDPTYAIARAYLGVEYLKRHRLNEAQQELDQALADAPHDLLVHIKYAEYYFRLGFYHRSVEMLEKGLKGPHHAKEHVVLMARQLLTQARQKCKSIVLRDPPDPRHLLRFLAPSWRRRKRVLA
ncbi:MULTISPECIES: tetratricopeptide repeat protein [Thermogemmatispora]|uniref:tetratricopeptide repeat protein n=1 Tax=Thermogemmatispora TaxID=768669 RepID=UPI00069C3E9A|nr:MULTISPECIES: tetratricopeptide repeat protein [Thermogemmatispora]